MTRHEKGQQINELTKKFKDNNHFYITDTSGLSVAEINKFRGMCFSEGVEYKVFKNTLIKRALDNLDTDYSSMKSTLKGFSGVMFVKENGKAPAKIIQKYILFNQGGPAGSFTIVNNDYSYRHFSSG